jgi:hypothetical protein
MSRFNCSNNIRREKISMKFGELLLARLQFNVNIE